MNAADKRTIQEMREDREAEASRAALESNEEHRILWAQRNGNDSGYDPYCYL